MRAFGSHIVEREHPITGKQTLNAEVPVIDAGIDRIRIYGTETNGCGIVPVTISMFSASGVMNVIVADVSGY